jgi:protein-S-isoprenylcysteine O-methyltransferase Ste14
MTPWKIRTGEWLFRYRSIVPLPLIAILFLCLRPGRIPSLQAVLVAAGLLIALTGEALRIHAVGFASCGTSGRENFLKARELNTTGLYSITRNPLYWGNFLIFSGLLIVYSNLTAWLIGVLFLAAHYHFIVLAEENFLSETHGDPYRAYCRRVRRWLPRFSNRQRPNRPFDPKKVVFAENDSLYNLAVTGLIILAYRERIFDRTIRNKTVYIGLFLLLTMLYVAVKIIKKRKPVVGG